MKILLIRHGEPDYEHDSLTEKGFREAEYLADRLVHEKIDDFYVSPLGRAQATAAPTLKRLHRQAVTLDWLKEFSPRIPKPHCRDNGCAWDWMPSDWTKEDIFYTENWYDHPVMKAGHVKEAYEKTCQELDQLLEKYGYKRNGRYYTCEQGSHKTICFICHFGLESILLSHLVNIPVMELWHGFRALPTSVTTVYTEEREKGIASFCITEYGSTAHLYVKGEKPSFMGRFAECFEDPQLH